MTYKASESQLSLTFASPMRYRTGICAILGAELFVVNLLVRHYFVLFWCIDSWVFVDYFLVFEARVHDGKLHNLLLFYGTIFS